MKKKKKNPPQTKHTRVHISTLSTEDRTGLAAVVSRKFSAPSPSVPRSRSSSSQPLPPRRGGTNRSPRPLITHLLPLPRPIRRGLRARRESEVLEPSTGSQLGGSRQCPPARTPVQRGPAERAWLAPSA